MAKALSQILSWVPLSKAIQQTTSGIPQPFPEEFLQPTEKTLGNKGRYISYTGERRLPAIAKYGAAARMRDQRPINERDIKLIHTFNEQRLDPLVMKYLRSADAYTHDLGLQEVKRQVREFAQLHVNLRVAATASVLRNGKIWYDINGNLLPSSAGAFEIHDFNMNPNNQNQLNGLIAQSWKLPSTDIPMQLRLLKKTAARITGYPLRIALYGENVPTYMNANDFVQDFLSRNQVWSNRYLESYTGEIPDGLFGFTWVPVYESFFEDPNGVNQDLWTPDTVVFTPEVTEEWWGLIEGSFEVPTTINVLTDAEAAMRSLTTAYGMFGYGVVTHNPPTVCNFYGDTMIPALKNPDVVYQSVVAF